MSVAGVGVAVGSGVGVPSGTGTGFGSATWVAEEVVSDAAEARAGIAVVRSDDWVIEGSLAPVEVRASGRNDSGVGIRTPFASVVGARGFDTLLIAVEVLDSARGIGVAVAGALSVDNVVVPSVLSAMDSPAGMGVGVGVGDAIGIGVGDGVAVRAGVGDGIGVGVGVGVCSGEGSEGEVSRAILSFALIMILEDGRAALRFDFDSREVLPRRDGTPVFAFALASGKALSSALAARVALSSAFAFALARAFAAFSFALASRASALDRSLTAGDAGTTSASVDSARSF